MSLFLFALVVRLCLVFVVALRFNGTLFGDDKYYFYLIRTHLSQQTSDWGDYGHRLWSLSLSFLMPASYAYKISGSSASAVLAVSAFIGSLVPALTARILLHYVTRGTAIAVGLVLAALPSQVLWSALLLKDSYIALGFILISFVLRWWSKQTKPSGILVGAVTLMVLTLYVQRIRLHSLIVLCIAIFLSVLLKGGGSRLVKSGVAISLLLVMPWAIGGGLAGSNFAKTLSTGLGVQRQAGANGAATAIVSPPVSLSTSSSSNTAIGDPSQKNDASEIAPNKQADTYIDDLLYLPSGWKVMLIDPTPSQLSRSKNLYFPYLEHLIWYPVLILAVYGAVTLRKWTIDLTFSGLLFVGLTTMWGLAEGNFGTAFRHRTEFVWIVFLFAGIGFQTFSSRNRKQNHSHL